MRKTNHLFSIITGFLIFLSPHPASAQNDTSYYFFDEDFSLSGDTMAPNMGIAVKEDSLWRLIVVNSSTQKIVMKGYYLSRNLQKEDGLFEYFFPDGRRRQRGYYHEGMQTGLWKTWNDEARLVDSNFFDNGTPKMVSRYYYDEDDHLIGHFVSDEEKQKKVDKRFYPDGSISGQSEFNGKAGQIKRYYTNGQASEIIVFDDNGKKTSVKHFREDGTEISEKAFAKEQEKKGNELMAALRATQPEFKGGRFQFEAFLQRNLRLPSNFSSTYHNIQSIQFSFTLNEKGKAENLILISPVDVELERSLLELLRVMPYWDMKGLKSYGPILQTINITAH